MAKTKKKSKGKMKEKNVEAVEAVETKDVQELREESSRVSGEIEIDQDEKPSQTYFVMRKGCLSCIINTSRLETIKERLENLRDRRAPKSTPEDHATELILKAMKFNKKAALDKKLVLGNLKTPSLDEVVDGMITALYEKIGFDEENGQTKLGSD